MEFVAISGSLSEAAASRLHDELTGLYGPGATLRPVPSTVDALLARFTDDLDQAGLRGPAILMPDAEHHYAALEPVGGGLDASHFVASRRPDGTLGTQVKTQPGWPERAADVVWALLNTGGAPLPLAIWVDRVGSETGEAALGWVLRELGAGDGAVVRWSDRFATRWPSPVPGLWHAG